MNKNKKAQMDLNTFTVGGIVILFIGAIVAISLLVPIFNAQNELTDKQTVTNDTLTYAEAQSGDGQINATYQMNLTKAQDGWRSTSCPIVISSVTNSSGTAYTLTTDYLFTDSIGNLTLVNTVKVNASLASDNITYVSYTYCQEGYNNDSGSRGMAGLIGLFSAMILLGFVAAKLFGKK